MDKQDYGMFDDRDSGAAMAQLAELAERQLDAERAVEQAEEDLAKRKKELAEIAEKELPELMQELKVEEFKLESGQRIQIKEVIRAGIAKKNQGLAFRWLRDSGNGKMIKRVIAVPFAAGADDEAEKFAKQLKEAGLEPDDKSAVHNQTLVAFVRRRLEAGEELPMDLFGVFRQRVAKISD